MIDVHLHFDGRVFSWVENLTGRTVGPEFRTEEAAHAWIDAQ